MIMNRASNFGVEQYEDNARDGDSVFDDHIRWNVIPDNMNKIIKWS